MADNPFAGLGLGMMGSDASYAKQGMTPSGDGGEFLGGLLSFMGVGKDTQDNIKNHINDFKTNPFAAVGPKITSDMYGVSPNAMGPAMPPQQASAVAPTSGVPPVASVSAQNPTYSFDQQIQQQRQQTQDILGKLIPRNLSNTPQ